MNLNIIKNASIAPGSQASVMELNHFQLQKSSNPELNHKILQESQFRISRKLQKIIEFIFKCKYAIN